MSANNAKKNALFLGLISICAFAATLPLAKNLIGALSGIEIGIYRSFIAALAAIPILIISKSTFPTRRQLKSLIITSCGVVYGFPILTAIAMQLVPVSHGGVVLAALPLCTSIWSVIFTGKNQSPLFWVSSILGFLFVLAFIIYQNGQLTFHWGDIALIGAAILAGMGYAQGGLLSSEMRSWEVICWTLCINFPILLIISSFLFEPSHLQLTPLAWFSILFLAFINSLLGFFTWNKALALGGIANISQLQLLQVFITYLYAIFFYHEPWSLSTVLFFTAAVICIFFSKKCATK